MLLWAEQKTPEHNPIKRPGPYDGEQVYFTVKSESNNNDDKSNYFVPYSLLLKPLIDFKSNSALACDRLTQGSEE